MANLPDQLERVAKSVREMFALMQWNLACADATGFRSRKFTEQW